MGARQITCGRLSFHGRTSRRSVRLSLFLRPCGANINVKEVLLLVGIAEASRRFCDPFSQELLDPPGFCALGYPTMTAMGFLMLHLVFGVIVGALHGARAAWGQPRGHSAEGSR